MPPTTPRTRSASETLRSRSQPKRASPLPTASSPWNWPLSCTTLVTSYASILSFIDFICFTSPIHLSITIFCAGDYKYTKNNVEDISVVEMFLQEVGLDEGQKDEIVAIIKGMGFKNEVSNKSIVEPTLEFAIVQDADRLDAIGAIGIARCFTYGGSKNSALHDPRILPRDSLSKEKYMSKEEKQTSINHFHEKLFKLKDMMKTEAGKRRAEKRHRFMEEFVAEFYEEWSGRA
uniref:Metal-dependent phosphohydrolase n=2 Tax=Zea mays TaxID=4577 RepID=A0A804LYF2_MAIZE